MTLCLPRVPSAEIVALWLHNHARINIDMIGHHKNAPFSSQFILLSILSVTAPIDASAEPLPLVCDLDSGGASASAHALDSIGQDLFVDGFPDCLSSDWWNGANADLMDGESFISGSAEVHQDSPTSLTITNEFEAVFVGDYSAQVTAGAAASLAFDVPDEPSPVEAELIFVRTRTGEIDGSFGGSIDGPGIDMILSSLLNGEPLGELRVPLELVGGATYRMFVSSDAELMAPGVGLQELSLSVSVPEARQPLQGAAGAIILAGAVVVRRRRRSSGSQRS